MPGMPVEEWNIVSSGLEGLVETNQTYRLDQLVPVDQVDQEDIYTCDDVNDADDAVAVADNKAGGNTVLEVVVVPVEAPAVVAVDNRVGVFYRLQWEVLELPLLGPELQVVLESPDSFQLR